MMVVSRSANFEVGTFSTALRIFSVSFRRAAVSSSVRGVWAQSGRGYSGLNGCKAAHYVDLCTVYLQKPPPSPPCSLVCADPGERLESVECKCVKDSGSIHQ